MQSGQRDVPIEKNDAIRVMGTLKDLSRAVHAKGPGLNELREFKSGVRLMVRSTTGGTSFFLRPSSQNVKDAEAALKAIREGKLDMLLIDPTENQMN